MADEERNEAEAAAAQAEQAPKPEASEPEAEPAVADASEDREAVAPAPEEPAAEKPEKPAAEKPAAEKRKKPAAEKPAAEAAEAAEAEPPAASEPEESGPEWYVLRVQAGKEDSVKRNLERKAKTEGLTDRIRRVLVPSELVSELKGKKKVVVERKLYPGYIMVEMVADEETIYHVRSTNGVGDFIGGEMNAPQPLSEQEVEQMLGVAETSTEEPKLDIKFKKGQNVKIKNGPFDGYSGAVDEVSPAKGTIRVIVTIFGRATPIELEYWEVESV